MTPLLEQFLSEARDFLQGIGEKLMQLETDPANAALMIELFRMVHTLKGNSGLFEFPEMTRVLHAGEDLMDAVRQERVHYSKELADRLLDAMDFVGMLCDEIEKDGTIGATHAADSARLAESLRQLIAGAVTVTVGAVAAFQPHTQPDAQPAGATLPIDQIPESVRAAAYRQACDGIALHWLDYAPAEESFFQGDDPFFQARGTPDVLWGSITARQPLPQLAELDAYRCVLDFHLLTAAPRAELDEYYRYMPDQVRIVPVPALLLAPHGDAANGNGLPVAAEATAAPASALTAEEAAILATLLAVQRKILALPVEAGWQLGRIKAVAAALAGCLTASDDRAALPGLEAATAMALEAGAPTPLLTWYDGKFDAMQPVTAAPVHATPQVVVAELPETRPVAPVAPAAAPVHAASEADGDSKFGRRADDAIAAPKSLKVDQAKIDRLMNLIGEMVVSKNALPYLAGRAETVFGVRELSREIKAQYSVINRIAEEMQDAIMQVRMMPVSFVFQRFPRLVRDISRKLGKEVNLVLEGEDTEADKNIIESLGDPLVHIVRNSLDHGFELPAVRGAAGKPAVGTLTIRATQESDRVVIEISDDGKGIDPAVIKRKAYEKGIIDEAAVERLSDQEAVNLVFAAGFSTADVVSDLSGRGVGMDVVRTAVEKVNGTVVLESEAGKGTRIRLSLPLSMAVSNVMIVESDGQTFGIPMDSVVETVRVPRAAVRTIKKNLATVLRGRIVPLKSINTLLGLAAAPIANAADELAVLVVRAGNESVGLLVDNFRETVDVILKPMLGVLAGLSAYAGSALMGDGSVLMVLNVKEIV
jgi:two-component system chemotaxis sensor kinase CheA